MVKGSTILCHLFMSIQCLLTGTWITMNNDSVNDCHLSDCADKPLHWTFKILIRQISSLWLKPKSSSVHTGRLKPVCSAWSDREDGRQPVISQRGRSTSNLTIAYPHFVTWVVTCRVIPSAGGLSGVDHKWERGPGDGGGPGGGGRGEGGGHYRGARWSQGQAWGE